MIKKENYISVQGWMRTELELKGNELLIYAIIYGFSQTEGQQFTGSLQYLSDWTGATKQGVIKNLKSLVDKGLIQKEEKFINGVKFVYYYSTEFTTPLNKVEQGGIKHSLPNNIDSLDNKDHNNRFVPPTLTEVQSYCSERKNSVDAQRFIDYYIANGWKVGKNKMKDWKAAVRTWERNGFSSAAKSWKEVGANGIKLKPESEQDHTLDGIL